MEQGRNLDTMLLCAYPPVLPGMEVLTRENAGVYVILAKNWEGPIKDPRAVWLRAPVWASSG